MISILILVKELQYLNDTIYSIINQTSTKFELLIASKNISSKALEKFSMPPTITFKELNGDIRCRELIDKMTSNYLIPINSGDLLSLTTVEEIEDLINKSEVSCIRAYQIEFDIKDGLNVLLKKPKSLNTFSKIVEQRNCKRLLFGFPLSINMGKFYCVHQSFIRKFANESVFELFFEDNPDFAIELTEAFWLEKILYLKRNIPPTVEHKRESVRKKSKFAKLWLNKYKLEHNLEKEGEHLIIRPTKSVHSVDIELTNHCNAYCVFCPNHRMKNKGFMKKEIFFKIIDKIKNENVSFIMFIGRGEPILHPDFLEFVKYVKENIGAKLEVFTNGFALTKDLINELVDLNDEYLNLRINVSLHSLKVDVHNKLVGLDLKVVSENLKYLMKMEDKIGHSVCFVKNKVNEAEMNHLRKYFDKLGVRNTEIALIYNKGGHIKDSSLFDVDFYKKNISKDNYLLWKKRRICHYTYNHISYFFNYKGEFVLCQEDFEDKLILGNIFRNDFSDIFNRVEEYKKEGGSQQCKRCNKLLHDLFHGPDLDPEARINEKLFIL